MKTVRVELGERSYPIHVGPGVRAELAGWIGAHASGRQLVVIADETVRNLHWNALREAIPAEPLLLTFPAGEGSKSLDTAGAMYDRLAEAHIERGALIVTFGGGVAGDLAGFVAATWLRGVRFVQVPTTLLAAVDAAVGGKTGVNLPAGKNLVGAFHQPGAVFVDLDFLKTLPARDLVAGLAESVKHAAIRQADRVGWMESHAAELVSGAPAALSELIAEDCRIKAEVVSVDEREAGLRAILNHGHTVGHAIERLLDFELRHGECVGLGMVVENELSRARGWLSAADAERVRALLAKLGLPTRLPRPIDPAQVSSLCKVDKKVQGGAAHFVLLRRLGEPQRDVADVTDAELAAALRVVQPG